MKQRLQKLLANAGVASRRAVEEMIRQGRVSVNGKVMVDLPILIDPQIDKVDVDGEKIKLSKHESRNRIYILLNKPKKVYSTNVAQGEQMLAIDLLPKDLPSRVYPVGRLEADTKGLLLMTNDGELTNALTHPKFGVPRVYRATVDGFLKDDERTRLAKDFGQLKIIRRSSELSIIEITVRERGDRPIRQILAAYDHRVRDLVRIAMGPITLDGLMPGKWRMLTDRELRLLRNLAKHVKEKK